MDAQANTNSSAGGTPDVTTTTEAPQSNVDKVETAVMEQIQKCKVLLCYIVRWWRDTKMIQWADSVVPHFELHKSILMGGLSGFNSCSLSTEFDWYIFGWQCLYSKYVIISLLQSKTMS